MDPIELLRLLDGLDIEAYIVGGYVRDSILGLNPKDADIVVFGINYENLIDKVSHLGRTDLVGKSFGVLKLRIGEEEFDLALGRTESRTGVGHTGFAVDFDSNIRPIDDCRRRDLTINTLLMDKNGNIIDYFRGQQHLKQRLLHPSSDAFAEDALRVLRAMQFASRFQMTASGVLCAMAYDMYDDFHALSTDRIYVEWMKWANGKHPHMGIKLLDDCGWLGHFKQIWNMKNTPQNPKYHSEGDVYTHTMLVLENASHQNDPILNFAALCHDFGKVTHTITDENGEITSPGHNDPTLTFNFCRSIGLPEDMTARIASLVREHMLALNDANPRMVRRLLTRLSTPNDFERLCQLFTADRLGKIPVGKIEPVNELRMIYREMGEVNSIKPIIFGRHLIEKGFKPGPHIGVGLKAAFEAQLDGQMDFNELLQIAILRALPDMPPL